MLQNLVVVQPWPSAHINTKAANEVIYYQYKKKIQIKM